MKYLLTNVHGTYMLRNSWSAMQEISRGFLKIGYTLKFISNSDLTKLHSVVSSFSISHSFCILYIKHDRIIAVLYGDFRFIWQLVIELCENAISRCMSLGWVLEECCPTHYKQWIHLYRKLCETLALIFFVNTERTTYNTSMEHRHLGYCDQFRHQHGTRSFFSFCTLYAVYCR